MKDLLDGIINNDKEHHFPGCKQRAILIIKAPFTDSDCQSYRRIWFSLPAAAADLVLWANAILQRKNNATCYRGILQVNGEVVDMTNNVYRLKNVATIFVEPEEEELHVSCDIGLEVEMVRGTKVLK